MSARIRPALVAAFAAVPAVSFVELNTRSAQRLLSVITASLGAPLAEYAVGRPSGASRIVALAL